MNQTIPEEERLSAFRAHLASEDRSALTIEKYTRDVRRFLAFAAPPDREPPDDPPDLTRDVVLAYKSSVARDFSPASANSMLAAVNTFLKFCGRPDLCVKQLRVQREAFCPEEKELTKVEYARLLDAARRRGNERLNLVLQTICGTGIRVSELAFVTAEAVERGEAIVRCKGKNRRIFLVPELRKKPLRYAKARGISRGAIFVTRRGKPLSRCAIWREMKRLCRDAHVSPSKVFPHNLRHLFARTFYGLERDIAKLADILGHASLSTTRIYVLTTAAEHRRQMEHMHLII